MTGRKLKELVNDLDEDELNLEVALYLKNAEDADKATGIEVYENEAEELPYVKGDWPRLKGNQILVIC